MKLDITKRNEKIVDGKVVSVQVHYKLSSNDNKKMSNGFIETDQVEASIDELKRFVVQDLKEQAEGLSAE